MKSFILAAALFMSFSGFAQSPSSKLNLRITIQSDSNSYDTETRKSMVESYLATRSLIADSITQEVVHLKSSEVANLIEKAKPFLGENVVFNFRVGRDTDVIDLNLEDREGSSILLSVLKKDVYGSNEGIKQQIIDSLNRFIVKNELIRKQQADMQIKLDRIKQNLHDFSALDKKTCDELDRT